MDRDAAMAIKKEEGTNENRQCRTTSPSFINRSITLMEEILQIFLRWIKDKLAIVLQIEHIDLKFNTKVSSLPLHFLLHRLQARTTPGREDRG